MKRFLFLFLFLSQSICIPAKGNEIALPENNKILGYNYFPEIPNPYGMSVHEFKQLTDHTFFCTHPRSGTNLTFSISTYLTKRPLYWNRTAGPFWRKVIVINRSMADLDYDQTPFFATHRVHEVNQFTRKNQLITTLRNYKEIFFRGSSRVPSQEEMNTYFSYLKLYDSWDEENRLLVRYEDLILRPFDIVKEIGNFFDAPEERMDQLIAEYDTFKEHILKSYPITAGQSYSKGKSLDFHRKKISPEVLKQVDEAMYRTNPHLFEKYLVHYREID